VIDESGEQQSLTDIIHTETITAIHGRPLSVQVVKIFGALFCTASPYKMRDAEKMNVFAAEKVDVINTALTMEGRTA
jgi:hypothetical protein